LTININKINHSRTGRSVTEGKKIAIQTLPTEIGDLGGSDCPLRSVQANNGAIWRKKLMRLLVPVSGVKGSVIGQQIPMMAIKTNADYCEDYYGRYLGHWLRRSWVIHEGT
jgi:hypothetical protein